VAGAVTATTLRQPEAGGRLRAGVVGLGSIAQRLYLPLLASSNRIELTGVVSRREAAARQAIDRYRVPRAHTTLAPLLADAPDIVFVHTETEAHAEAVEEALTAGAHVYVDKPLAPSYATCRALAERAEASGLLLAVGFNRRFAPMHRLAVDWAQAQGPLQVVRLGKHRHRLYEQDARTAVFDDVIHLLDLMCWLLGSDVQLTDGHVRVDSCGRMVQVACSATNGSGDGQVLMHRGAADGERLEVFGPGRSGVVEDLEAARLLGDGPPRSTRPDGWASVSWRRGFDSLLDHVLDSTAQPSSCSVAASRVLQAHRLAEQLLT
jgi:virulence factor